MNLRLGSVPVFVSDQKRAIQFYCDKLGCEKTMDMPLGGDLRWITVALGFEETELILFHPSIARSAEEQKVLADRIGTWTGIIFLTDDIGETHELLHQRGVEFVTEPRQQHWGGWEATFRDPDGNEFHLVQRTAEIQRHATVAQGAVE